MNIGNKIKELRKKQGITQEQLAESIGISFQAVSKWENKIALPDITLTPVLAGYFGVSMDELFGFSLKEIEQDVENIAEEAHKYRESNPLKSRQILEAGLEKYPENDILLNNLLYVMNYSEEPDKTIAVADRLIEKTARTEVKYDALRFLAYAYKAKGDYDSAEAAIEQIPEIYFTKLTEQAYLLSGNAKFEAAKKQKMISFENLIQMMWKLAECYEENGNTDKAITEVEKALMLITVIEDVQFECYAEYFNKQLVRLNKNKK
ncbi:MAG: helix-turn-helix domain-containing protein [Ruminococcaceae bacterium]|nr:helix-turn-helix domain-containing protein [Oscillospiraceae bacterium]